jgi:hypothetical protein
MSSEQTATEVVLLVLLPTLMAEGLRSGSLQPMAASGSAHQKMEESIDLLLFIALSDFIFIE